MSSRVQEREKRRAERLEAERRQQAAAARKRRLALLGGVLAVAAVVAALLIVVSQRGSNDPATPAADGSGQLAGVQATQRLFAGLPQNGQTLGRANADFTLVEFGDLQCPGCGYFSREVLPTVVDRYVRAGKMKIQFEPVSIIGPDSQRAALMAAAAAQQDKLWPFIDVWYANQPAENSGYVSEDFLRRIGRGVPGFDAQQAIADQNDPRVQQIVNSAQQRFTAGGFNSTPSFMLGRTGGTLQPLQIEDLRPATVRKAIDEVMSR
jgi:protein-disulfide isomerase